MKFNLSLFIILFCLTSYSQCFDCGHSLGGHVEDYVIDIDKASDGIILTFNPGQGWGRSIYKYDFNCNLIWANEFLPESGSTDNMGFYNTTVDENNNIYSIIGNNRGGVVVDGFSIEMGNSLIKLTSSGNIEWVRKISDERYLPRQVHVWNNNVFVVGELYEGINTNIGLTIQNGFNNQYFIAKFDSSGNLMDAQQYGEKSSETLYDSQIDENGNIYFTGSITPASHSVNIKTYLNKVDSNLGLIWSKELSDNQPSKEFKPMTLYYNDTNGKLYVWSKYYKNVNFYNNTVDVSNGCDVGSVVMEISKDSGDLENYKIIDNCGFLTSVGNGIGNVEQRSFMTHEGSNLYVLSSFRGEITIGSETLTTTQDIYGEHNSDLILYKIDLSNFSEELILRSSGENYYPSSAYRDLAGPIIAVDNSLHITSSFMSYPMTINDITIVNNSGNNARDVLYYKHKLNQEDLTGSILFNNTCFSQATVFTINGDFDSVFWDFDDLSSGLDNTSIITNPTHTFTSSGTYNVTALVTCGTDTETIEIEVIITGVPTVNQIDDLHGCEDAFGSQKSTTFDTSSIVNDLIGNQANVSVLFFDQNDNKFPEPFPSTISNRILGQETLTARVFYTNNPYCYTEVFFDLIVDPLPEIFQMDDLHECDNDFDGFSEFDLSSIEKALIGNQSNLILEYYDSDDSLIQTNLLSSYSNIKQSKDFIRVKANNIKTNCTSETIINLIVDPLPIANTLDNIVGCDDNNDGISEYFNTSNVEYEVLKGQVGMAVSYFNSNGNQLSSPLPNPYTNTIANNETLTVRVTNVQTGCYSDTSLNLTTSTQPQINKPLALYTCDEANGFAYFDTSAIESELIGKQTGLLIFYFDENGTELPNPLPVNFQNTKAWTQTIYVKVENELNPLCFSETSFDLIVNGLPEINLKNEYFLCDLEPSLHIKTSSTFNSWEWTFNDDLIMSNSFEANLIDAGTYTLQVTEINNGIVCENSFSFNLIRSILPTISEVKIKDISDDNYIEVITSGDGDFEYTIDGFNFQDENTFHNLVGGVYNVEVRDKNGCGSDKKEVVLVDYPKFFTPNYDGYNDYWQIQGIEKFPNAVVYIYNRFGKVLKQINSSDIGWDGTYNGQLLPSSDYWFTSDLGDGRALKGHFSLIR